MKRAVESANVSPFIKEEKSSHKHRPQERFAYLGVVSRSWPCLPKRGCSGTPPLSQDVRNQVLYQKKEVTRGTHRGLFPPTSETCTPV